jgi:branched-chain amino acid transport system ATP-binding protein
MTDVLLRGQGITRRWGGLVAVNDVALELKRGEVHAVIGTNGAGKSTLINILSGEIPPSAGTVQLLGQDVTAWSQPKRARAGLGRSYQRNTIYPGFSVLENCRLAAQARTPRPWHWWQSAQHCEASLGAARQAAQQAGLADVLERLAGSLSHGQKRQLEIAMCLATAPQVLLLDEPLAGMGAEETDRMLALLATLKAGHAILLVEHDMDAVFRIADRDHRDGQRRGDLQRRAPGGAQQPLKCRPPTWVGTEMATTELILEARDIHAWYGSSHVLHGVAAADCQSGETVGLLGRNGMGKSTLIRSLLGHVAQRDGPDPPVGAATCRAPSRTRWRAWAWPTCPRAAASSPT